MPHPLQIESSEDQESLGVFGRTVRRRVKGKLEDH